MVVYNGRLHLVTDTGLWSYDDGWQRPRGAPRSSLSTLHVGVTGSLYIAGQRSVWRGTGKGWKLLWKGLRSSDGRLGLRTVPPVGKLPGRWDF